MATVEELQAQIMVMMAQLQEFQVEASDHMDLGGKKEGASIDNSNQIAQILNKKIEFYNSEIRKIDQIFSDFTSRLGLLIAIAGLLSILPSMLLSSESYMSHYLIWTFPLLLVTIFTYYPSSLRVQSIVKGATFVPSGHGEEVYLLQDMADYLEILWKEYVSRYEKVLRWNRVTNLLIYTYIISLGTNFYFLFLKLSKVLVVQY